MDPTGRYGGSRSARGGPRFTRGAHGGPTPLELLTPAEMARADAAAIAGGVPMAALMAAAGRAVAEAARRRFRPCRTLVLAGPGNNGGDGYVAARLLHRAGWPVAVAALAPPRPGSDAALAAAGWRGPTVAFSPAEVRRAGLVIDAVFGAGLARDLDGVAAETLRAVPDAVPVLAVDVPSGLDGGTGQVRGFAPRAAVTVTFFRCKPGHLLLPGRELCGPVVLADIGLPAAVLAEVAPRAFHNRPGLWTLPRLDAAGHKYARGHLTIIGGGAMTGAARMASEAAHRAGAGLVTLVAPDPESAAVYRGGDPATIVSTEPVAGLLEDERRAVWLLGPGLPPSAETRAMLRQVVDGGRRAVADAGALLACAGSPDALAGAAVLTPHAGEFARVFGPVGDDKPAAARAAAARTGAVVLLKGADTVVAAPDGRVAINDNAPPSLAIGGTGDVLAGIVAALLCQGMAPFEAAAAAVWLHGEAARAGPTRGLVPTDLITLLPAALTHAAGT